MDLVLVFSTPDQQDGSSIETRHVLLLFSLSVLEDVVTLFVREIISAHEAQERPCGFESGTRARIRNVASS